MTFDTALPAPDTSAADIPDPASRCLPADNTWAADMPYRKVIFAIDSYYTNFKCLFYSIICSRQGMAHRKTRGMHLL